MANFPLQYFRTRACIQFVSQKGIRIIALFEAKATIPRDCFLEIFFDFPTRPAIIEREYHEKEYLRDIPNFSAEVKVKSPWLSPKLLNVGDRVEIVIRIFEDQSRTRLLGEHHEFQTYTFTRDQLRQGGLRASLALNRSRVFESEKKAK